MGLVRRIRSINLPIRQALATRSTFDHPEEELLREVERLARQFGLPNPVEVEASEPAAGARTRPKQVRFGAALPFSITETAVQHCDSGCLQTMATQ